MAAALEPTRKRDALLNSPALTLLAESPGPTCLWLSKSYAPSCCQARVPCPTHSDARFLQRVVAATPRKFSAAAAATAAAAAAATESVAHPWRVDGE